MDDFYNRKGESNQGIGHDQRSLGGSCPHDRCDDVRASELQQQRGEGQIEEREKGERGDRGERDFAKNSNRFF